MSNEIELKEAFEDIYQRAGKETGYWGKRFIRAVRKNGAITTAKKMLKPRNSNKLASGLESILNAGRPELSVEAIILDKRFSVLFTTQELVEAQQRLGIYQKESLIRMSSKDRLYPDELDPGQYIEGAKKQVRVNAYERDPKDRKSCINQHGFRCSICNLLLEERYGDIGKDFIHVHHLKPLAELGVEYKINPITDLSPVCPNCHAMLHRPEKVLSIEELRNIIIEVANRRMQTDAGCRPRG